MALLSGIALPPLSHVGTVGLLKNCDPGTVGRVRTSRYCCPPPLQHSWFRRLAPYCFQLRRTAPPHLLLRPLSPSDRSLGRLPWLRTRWLILWLCRGSMSSASGACGALYTRFRRFPVGLRPPPRLCHTHQRGCLDYGPPFGYDLRPTAGLLCPRFYYPSCAPRSYVFVLLAPSAPALGRITAVG